MYTVGLRYRYQTQLSNTALKPSPLLISTCLHVALTTACTTYVLCCVTCVVHYVTFVLL